MATILLVDDDEAFRRMLQRLLVRAGYEVIEAADGRSALQALAGVTVDLAIIDIIMPVMEGIETIRSLQQTHAEMKIIAMSGGGRIKAHDYLTTAQAFGAVRVFRKPFDSKELIAAIEEVLH